MGFCEGRILPLYLRPTPTICFLASCWPLCFLPHAFLPLLGTAPKLRDNLFFPKTQACRSLFIHQLPKAFTSHYKKPGIFPTNPNKILLWFWMVMSGTLFGTQEKSRNRHELTGMAGVALPFGDFNAGSRAVGMRLGHVLILFFPVFYVSWPASLLAFWGKDNRKTVNQQWKILKKNIRKNLTPSPFVYVLQCGVVCICPVFLQWKTGFYRWFTCWAYPMLQNAVTIFKDYLTDHSKPSSCFQM